MILGVKRCSCSSLVTPCGTRVYFCDDLDRFSSRLLLVWVPLGLPFWPPNPSRDTPGLRKNRERWCIVDTVSQSAFRCGSRLVFWSENIVNNESAARAYYRSFWSRNELPEESKSQLLTSTWAAGANVRDHFCDSVAVGEHSTVLWFCCDRPGSQKLGWAA